MPCHAVHYAVGPPFHSLLDLPPAARQRVLDQGQVPWPARYADPTYVETRQRVEAELHRQLLAAGGQPLRARPHYAMIGRSPRSEAEARPGKRAWLLDLSTLPALQVSFTFGDSFLLDPAHRRARAGPVHPAAGTVHLLAALPALLRQWQAATPRPAWQEVELQLWFDPDLAVVEVVEIG